MQKVDFLNLTPLTLLQKTSFLAHFVAKSRPFARFGGCVAPPLATGLVTRDRHRAEKGCDAHDVIIMICAGSERLISIINVREIRR